MSNLVQKIVDELHFRSVVLVGPTNSGKSYWIQHIFIPHIESLGKKVKYLKDGNQPWNDNSDVVISDEAEVLFDEKYLQGNSTEPYYTKKYLEKVNHWFKNYSIFPRETIFVVTRNEPDQIENLTKNMHQSDWDGRNIVAIEFQISSKFVP